MITLKFLAADVTVHDATVLLFGLIIVPSNSKSLRGNLMSIILAAISPPHVAARPRSSQLLLFKISCKIALQF